ncbi:bifunctional UDP-N-acetylglucosamine diphosphorylase/glucosamine-1-phosphate N-acetyltransferase GlmU [Desulfovibrio ferrophilus]|uniref:Bifunctional protein GlmU n=1 Tax=Desulfovibrio ferrophilus TaxID=241368 RepID=A0A2Z6B2K0_9BACT|nr:bifunctional UDP-N-acetylglucosamine diphosphorylase/glucosamine-1-phosphate N-acetyltransferase GlmU [Desulfovibrio ferrophilus]BBD09656.1 bifunctional protein GlmU [Desulfovibrio ferrophilus]
MATAFDGKGLAALVLAAGKGTRMRSEKPKVLHTLLDVSMLGYVYDALDAIPPETLLTVIGHGSEQVKNTFPQRESGFILQTRQLGTGHALQTAWKQLEERAPETVLVVNGDTPLISTASLIALVDTFRADQADLAFLTVSLNDAGAYGRVVRNADDSVAAIIEAKDYDEILHGPENGEINAGIYALRMSAIKPLLELLSDDNASGEFYITDLIALGVERGLKVRAVRGGQDLSLLGVNSPAELVAAEDLLRQRIVNAHLNNGVIIRQPAQAIIGPKVILEPGCELAGPCELIGDCSVAAGASIGPNVWIKDSHIGTGSIIKPFSHLEEARVDRDCQIGPYARLRPQAVVEDQARVGNFVEMKKAILHQGAKASHLTYLGDAEVGAGANIGAGTITCNYDGVNKHRTVIGEKAFIGSNTALVAPVTIGKGAVVGAGSVITKNVEPETLAITRSKQKSLPWPKK